MKRINHMTLAVRGRIGRSSVLVVIALFLISSWSCSPKEKKQGREQRVVPVTVASVVQKNVPLQLRAIGNVQAFTTVAIKSIVGGEIVGVHFKEGQDVAKGDLLFTIDSRPYEAAAKQAEANLAKSLAAVRQAEANLTRDTAQAKNAGVQADRYKTLAERNLISTEQFDQVRTTSESLEATLLADRAALENARASVQADRASVENARLQLSYSYIRSPIAGRTGSLLVSGGNIIKVSDAQPLAVVNQISPVNVVFGVPEKVLPDIRKHMASGKVRVEALPPNDGGPPEQGSLTFVDNTIDNSTGTIQLKATFQNASKRLWPGQFVNTIVTLATQDGAIVVASKAIQTGQQGQFIFVVKSDMTVESRPIQVDRALNNEESVVAKGLSSGETIVLDGQLQLVPGVKVTVRKPSAAPGAGRRPA
jgi:membrane fusion protein, multidrug efflux system